MRSNFKNHFIFYQQINHSVFANSYIARWQTGEEETIFYTCDTNRGVHSLIYRYTLIQRSTQYWRVWFVADEKVWLDCLFGLPHVQWNGKKSATFLLCRPKITLVEWYENQAALYTTHRVTMPHEWQCHYYVHEMKLRMCERKRNMAAAATAMPPVKKYELLVAMHLLSYRIMYVRYVINTNNKTNGWWWTAKKRVRRTHTQMYNIQQYFGHCKWNWLTTTLM